ncbi:MAG: amino acid ABC transporter substrate-binding protein, partial [Deltaproteobacteria bacterium]|nr:amino acid ABC transporter substrate-binding protein [Deltaproteobacteria bacterium]
MMRFLVVCAAFFLVAGAILSAAASPEIAGLPEGEAQRLGEIMYREGLLPSGEPVKAVAMGDIPVDGQMFTCDDCHQRSGIGSVEGNVVTWPTNGKELYKARRQTQAFRPPRSERGRKSRRRPLPSFLQKVDARPAYTDETLARVLRLGVDPAGRRLNPAMPRYILDDRDMAIMVHYLKNLSVVQSPGVDNTTITFATVVTDGIPEEEREAMLAVLRAYVHARNVQVRNEERRAKAGPFYRSERQQSYRRFKLLVWELTGPPDTWRKQLEARYREEPVFGLLGGMAAGGWAPIHEYCEENRIPSIFPLTDLPVLSDTDWYTLYFSKGVYLEGETAAKYLHSVRKFLPDARVVQVLRNDPKAVALARGFENTWAKWDHPFPEKRILGQEETLTGKLLNEIARGKGPAVLLLWIEARDLPAIAELGRGVDPRTIIFLSSTLLGEDLSVVPDGARDRVYLTYPYILPQEGKVRLNVVKGWLKSRNIPVSNMK